MMNTFQFITTIQLTWRFPKDADGVVRVAGTRVTLDTVVAAFEEGATAEEIAQQYPSLAFARAG